MRCAAKTERKLKKNDCTIPWSIWCGSADSCAACELNWWYFHVHWRSCDEGTVLQRKMGTSTLYNNWRREAPLLQRDCAMCYVSWNLVNCRRYVWKITFERLAYRKLLIWTYPTSIRRPRWGCSVAPLKFHGDFWRQKTRVILHYLCDPTYSRFNTVPACDGQPDDSIYRVSIVLHGIKRVTWTCLRPLGGSLSPKANTGYILPVHKIWRLSLQPFWNIGISKI